jgi:two-component system NtrC family response regulator
MPEDKRRLLIVEDDAGLQTQMRWTFDDFEVLQATNGAEAIAHLRKAGPAVMLLDLGLPPDPEGVSEGLATLADALSLAPHTKVIVVTGNADRDNAVRAVGAGAYDFYQKPLDTDVLRLIVERAFHIHALEAQNRELLGTQVGSPAHGIVATDPGMQKACRIVEKVAPTAVSVLVLGESGTGKELIARALHNLSDRRDARFVAINCAAIPEQLLESELFGHEKGAFTGAIKTTPGKIEVAHRGTLFLDEIGDMPLALQAKLLRFLQERSIERIGGRAEIPVDVRIVCATHQNLKALIGAQRFREDLFYRLSEVTVQLPPLRERPGAAVVLAQTLLHRFGAAQGTPRRGFTPDALAAIQAYGWPGNVRELENKVKTAVIMAEGALVGAEDLGLAAVANSGPVLDLREIRSRAEREAVHQALAIAGDNISRAADLLGVSRPTLYDLLDRFGISRAHDES